MSAVSKLIVHADDFGETDAITDGIVAGIEAGAVTSTTIMANMPGTERALGLALQLEERASFGVHLNFCEGLPLTHAPSLIGEDGRFVRKRELALRAVTGRLSHAEIRAEMIAQIDRIRAGGVRASHVDGHKHLHQLPQIRQVLPDVLRSFGIDRVRVSAERTAAVLGSPGRAARELFARRAAEEWRGEGLRFAGRIANLKTLMSMKNVRAALAKAVARGDTLEVFCHPGTAESDLEKPGSCRRHDELQFLLSPSWQEATRACQVRLVTWWEV